ncbi:LON peptidase substrate-binding domain-containing protein [Acetobacteraceae bacterium KSS8]|uniref:LON peptidase substrate-binding domain-containing protein n=1 Tax=Endosaccharibacter trunci TaxID=2812733 RepID=A0ABT1W519_9PROT|nr:LON peptidase substrate-binding domain-containing protein [Acetobacteraceae bacterium KSS8]
MASRSLRRVPRLRDLRLHALPDELPVFPLPGAVLLPSGKLPLNIFEPRYQCMLEDALASDRLIGMIQPLESAENASENPSLFAIGCVGRITSFSEREDGTASITLTGLVRFRTLEEAASDRPYRSFAVSYDGFGGDMERAEEVAFDRAALVGALRRYFHHRGFEARWDAIDQMDDETLLVTLSMICPFLPAEKQALLEAPTLPDRARALLALLEMAGHEDDETGQHSA